MSLYNHYTKLQLSICSFVCLSNGRLATKSHYSTMTQNVSFLFVAIDTASDNLVTNIASNGNSRLKEVLLQNVGRKLNDIVK